MGGPGQRGHIRPTDCPYASLVGPLRAFHVARRPAAPVLSIRGGAVQYRTGCGLVSGAQRGFPGAGHEVRSAWQVAGERRGGEVAAWNERSIGPTLPASRTSRADIWA